MVRSVVALSLLVIVLTPSASSEAATLSLVARFTSREVGDTVIPIPDLVVPFTVTFNDSAALLPSSTGDTVAQFDGLSISGFDFALTPPAGWSNPVPLTHTAYARERRIPVPYASPYSAGDHSAIVHDYASQSIGSDRHFHHQLDLSVVRAHVFTTPDVGIPTADSLVQLLMAGGWINYRDFYNDYCSDFGCDPSWLLNGSFEAAVPAVTTPEPSSALLALTGLVALLRYSRPRRR